MQLGIQQKVSDRQRALAVAVQRAMEAMQQRLQDQGAAVGERQHGQAGLADHTEWQVGSF